MKPAAWVAWAAAPVDAVEEACDEEEAATLEAEAITEETDADEAEAAMELVAEAC